MDPNANNLQEFDALLEKLCDQRLSSAEWLQLEAFLRLGDPWLARYLSYVDLHGTLWLLGGNPGHIAEDGASIRQLLALSPSNSFRDELQALPAQSAPPIRRSRNRFQGVQSALLALRQLFRGGSVQISSALLLILMIGALVAGSIGTWWFDQQASPSLAQEELSSALPGLSVAYLTTANGCNWGSGSLGVWTVGRGVNSGDELTLHEGIAEFRLANGVSLGIEGPASLMLVSPSTLVLQYGKLTAHVPWGSSDFKVVAAGCRIGARDAEFGISLTNNKLDVHVFSGEVTAGSSIVSARFDDEAEIDDDFVADDDESYFTDAVIAAGRVLRLTTHGEVLKIAGWDKAEPSLFVAKLSMSGPLSVTQEYVDRVLASQPLSYWRFEKIVDSKISNEIESGPPLKIKDKSELVGSNGNLSAEFRSDGDWYIRTTERLPLAGSDYSLEAWVKPSHLHWGRIVRLECGDGHHSAAALELQGGLGDSYGKKYPGTLRYIHRAYKGKRDQGKSCYSSGPYEIRRWQHVVAIKNGSQMKLYLNGKFNGMIDEDTALPKDPAVLVGVYNDRHPRKFIGQLDELAIYGRALSEDEIGQHYEAVNRAAKGGSKSEGKSRPAGGILKEI